jgi:glycerophosphoryl diester phosphodiesterase
VTTTGPARPRVVAHRGAATVAPEHTIAAYEAAVAAGADALWLDVQLSSDEQLVVLHDARLERTTSGRGPVREMPLRDLKRLDAGRWFGWRFRGQRIQTLAEVIERFRERVDFVVALPGAAGLPAGIEERLLTLLNLSDAAERTLVTAADPETLARCHAVDPDARLAARPAGPVRDPADIAPAGALSALCLDAALAAEADVRRCRAAGLECYLGVVPGAAEARRLAAWQPTGLILAAAFDFR